MNLTREIKFRPAFDKRHADPKKNYGIHGVDMLWILKGPVGAVQFLVFTGWHLPHIIAEWEQDAKEHPVTGKQLMCQPIPADLGYHSPTPVYDGQQCNECDLLPGKKCYYDGSGLNAEPVFKLLVEKGDEAVWKFLEDYYRDIFDVPSDEPFCSAWTDFARRNPNRPKKPFRRIIKTN